MTAPLIAGTQTLRSQRIVAQATHGFTANQVIYRNGTTWALARSDAGATLGTTVVLAVIDAGNFVRATDGDVIGGLTGLTAGQPVHVSAATAGAVATAAQGTAPASAVAHNVVGEAISATEYIFHPYTPLPV